MQNFSEHQLPISLGGLFHPHEDPPPVSPLSPSHAPSRLKLPRQQSHPDHLCEIKGVTEVEKVVAGKFPGNMVPVLDSRGRSQSGSATDRTHLRPLQPIFPPQQKHPSGGHAPSSPPSGSRGNQQGQRSQASCRGEEFCWLKSRNRFQTHNDHPDTSEKALLPPQVITGKATPTSSAHNRTASDDDTPLTSHSKATPTSSGKIGSSGGGGIASKILNFERQKDSSGGALVLGQAASKSQCKSDGDVNKMSRGGRLTKALVPVQIGGAGGEGPKDATGDGGQRTEEPKKRFPWGEKLRGAVGGGGAGEQQGRELEEEQRKKREEEMRRQRVKEDRLQRERREKAALKKLTDDYENVDLGPLSASKARSVSKTPDPKSSPGSELQRKPVMEGGNEASSLAYENVHYTRQGGGGHSPDTRRHHPSSQGGKQVPSGRGGGGGGGGQHKARHYHKATGKGEAPTGKQSPSNNRKKKHQYENITILTPSGPVPYLHDMSSSEDSEDYSGEESPAPREVIYENFGSDAGNQMMTPVEMERHLAKKEKKGMSAEYLKIKNEPLAHPHITCK